MHDEKEADLLCPDEGEIVDLNTVYPWLRPRAVERLILGLSRRPRLLLICTAIVIVPLLVLDILQTEILAHLAARPATRIQYTTTSPDSAATQITSGEHCRYEQNCTRRKCCSSSRYQIWGS